jgi:MFS family permease
MRQRGLFYGWVVLAAAATIVCVGMGALFSLGVFLKPIEDSMGWSRTAISTVALLNWIAMGLGSFAWGWLSDRIGTRAVAVAGGSLLGLGLVLSSQAQTLWQLYLTFGFAVGFAVGAFYAPLTSTATRWFTANRGLAVALVSAGIGVGILVVSPLARWLITQWEWRIAMLLLGDLAWLVIIPMGLLVRNAPDEMGTVALGGAAGGAARDFSTAGVLGTPRFWAIALTHFACCAAHSGPIFHMVTHATDQGVAKMAAAAAFGVSGLASIAGRIGGGVLADRFGAKRVLVAGLALQAAMVLLYPLARDGVAFYALAVPFGVAYGGVMPLYALLTREAFGAKVMGSAYGAVFLVSTLGMGLGSFAGGWLHDQFGGYGWLYLSSFAVGTLAVLLALGFRVPRPLSPDPLARAIAVDTPWPR